MPCDIAGAWQQRPPMCSYSAMGLQVPCRQMISLLCAHHVCIGTGGRCWGRAVKRVNWPRKGPKWKERSVRSHSKRASTGIKMESGAGVNSIQNGGVVQSKRGPTMSKMNRALLACYSVGPQKIAAKGWGRIRILFCISWGSTLWACAQRRSAFASLVNPKCKTRFSSFQLLLQFFVSLSAGCVVCVWRCRVGLGLHVRQLTRWKPCWQNLRPPWSLQV